MTEEPKVGSEEESSEEEEGEQPSGSHAKSLVEEARELNAGLKQTLREVRAERQALEELRATEMLGGSSQAGQVPEKKEETPQEYKDRILQNG